MSEIIGSILMFALVIVLLVFVQVSAVPGWNQQVEYEHNQRLQSDMGEFSEAVGEATRTGTDTAVVIQTAARYPPRPFLLNPPAAQGRLETIRPRTAAEDDLQVQNVDIVGVDNYAPGNTIQTETRAVRYVPDYNQYQNAPETTLDTGVLYNSYESGAIRTIDRRNLVNGTNINLLVVDGRLSESSGTPSSVRVHATSGNAQRVPIRNQGGDLTLQIPTRLNESQWETLLADQLDPTGSVPDAYVADLTVTENANRNYNTLVVTMEPGSYGLRMAEVGVGEDYTVEDARYVTHVEGGGSTVRAGAREELVAEVRDRYNNPVAGERVEFAITTGSGSLSNGTGSTGSTVSAVSDGSGEASVTYQAPAANGTATVEMRIDENNDGDFADPGETTQVDLTVLTSLAGGSSTDGVSEINPGENDGQPWLVEATSSGDDAVLTFDNDANVDLTIQEARISFYFSNEGKSIYQATFMGVTGNTVLEVPGQFEAVSGPTLSADGNAGEQASFTLDVDPLSGNAATQGDFFVLSIEFGEPGGGTRTLNYFVGVQ